MPDNTLIIIGGGLAGLAAATALAERGMPVTLLESRPRLGGRASSFLDRTTGVRIDNCQHVSMGCCTNFRRLCETVGLDGLLRSQPELYFVGPDGKINHFAAGILPAPLHLLLAFRRLSYLSPADLRGIARGLRALVRMDSERVSSQSFEDWLREQQQTPAAVERFWHVVLVSALSETLDRIDVGHARKVFVNGFLANRQGWQVQIPTVPLDELYGERLTRWLADRGATVRLQAGVERLIVEDGRAVAVELRNGERLTADQYILAVPHHLVLPLLPEPLRGHPQLAGIERLESAPISSVHLWFDRPITDLPHAVFVERLSQWIFNRTALQEVQKRGLAPSSPRHGWLTEVRRRCLSPFLHAGEVKKRGLASPMGPCQPTTSVGRRSQSPFCHNLSCDEGNNGQTWYYQVVISASRDLAGRPRDETIAEVVGDLTAVWPETGRARLVHSRLVTEHRAVFSVTPGVEALRPPQQSPVPNLQLAGDWTRTGWPATMEGAVRSGYLAAENVLSHLGRPEQVLQPDLPVARLSRWLLQL